MDAVLNWLWQGGVVALAAFGMLRALKDARANVRYTVCWAAAIFVVVLPVVPSPHPVPVAEGAFAAPQGDAIVALPFAWWSSAVVMLGAWMLWAGVHTMRFLSAISAIRRARARSRAFPADVESLLPRWRDVRGKGRRATLVLSDSVATAAVLGWGHPVIAVAPALVHTLDRDDLDRILVHEWAHVQRRDDLANILQIAVRTVAGWHPAVWLLDRRLQVEREIACDEMAVAITGSAKSYAACLLKLASLRGALREIRTAPAVLSSSGLRARVVTILSPRPSIAPARSRGIASAIVASLGLMCAGLGGVQLVEAADETLPAIWPHLRAATAHRLAPAPASALSSNDEPFGAARRAVAAPAQSPQPGATAPISAQPERTMPDVPGPLPEASALTSIPIAQSVAHLPAAPSPVVPQAPANTSTAAGNASQSPWDAAAAGGAAIGRKSKDAGVATAGFFTRMARRVAGSF